MSEIHLIDPKELKAWDKNPRVRDPERFEWIKISLAKFGFVLPIYANPDGTVLYSGHQRTDAAIAVGFERVPVVFITPITKATKTITVERIERSINILFNLCTNDHQNKCEYGAVSALSLDGLEQYASLPDVIETNPYPCVNQFTVNPADFLEQIAAHPINQSTVSFANELYELTGTQIPVVLDKDGKIINGAPRLQAALTRNQLEYPAVRYNEKAEFLQLFLNKITMSFDLQKVFGDELRWSDFLPLINQKLHRKILGVGFYGWVFGPESRKGGKHWRDTNLTKMEGEILQRWVAEHGTTVVDFGAGRLDNTVKLQAVGINCIAFEPFPPIPGTNTVSPKSGRNLGRRFLRWIATKPKIDSLFVSSVFNSVPFREDRELLMTIFQAICSKNGTTLYLHTLNESGLNMMFGNKVNKTSKNSTAVLLDSEPGLYVTGITTKGMVPAVQKFYGKEELIDMGQRYFKSVKYNLPNSGSHGIKCRQPHEINHERLVEALEFEFDLPYPGNQRMGLADLAIEAFTQYTGFTDLQEIHERRKRAKLLAAAEQEQHVEVAI